MNKDYFLHMLNESTGDEQKLEADLLHFEKTQLITKTVFGVDIFEYSKMVGSKQFAVPFVIDSIFTNVIQRLDTLESAFFSSDDLQSIKDSLIDTGDGFFIILDDPFKGLIFACYLALEIELLRTRNTFPALMKISEDYVFRFAIATGNVFQYNEKYYGDAIIRCARIMSKDRLNRCLIDKDTYFWFFSNANGIETLRVMNFFEVSKIREATTIYEKKSSTLFPTGMMVGSTFNTIQAFKIGQIEVKRDHLDIYNLFIQTQLRIGSNPPNAIVRFGTLPLVSSVGTPNVNGL